MCILGNGEKSNHLIQAKQMNSMMNDAKLCTVVDFLLWQ